MRNNPETVVVDGTAYSHPEGVLYLTHFTQVAMATLGCAQVAALREAGVLDTTAAFGGHGVLIPERRSASITAVAWRTSAGAAARLPVARATNLNRTLLDWAKAGVQLVGLDAGGDVSLDDYDGTGPTVVVVGSEGKGLSRLVRENCDSILSIPIASGVESLNASVAAGSVLSEFARQRRAAEK
mgnify:CR=1 FL=1